MMNQSKKERTSQVTAQIMAKVDHVTLHSMSHNESLPSQMLFIVIYSYFLAV